MTSEAHPLDQLSAYIDEVVNNEERLSIETHLTQCQDCERRYQELLHIRKVLRESPILVPPESLYRSVRDRSGMAKKVTWRRLRIPFAAIAALCLLLFAVWLCIDKFLKHQLTLLFLDMPQQIFKHIAVSTPIALAPETQSMNPSSATIIPSVVTPAPVVTPATTTSVARVPSLPKEEEKVEKIVPTPAKPPKKVSGKTVRPNRRSKVALSPERVVTAVPGEIPKTSTRPSLVANLPSHSQVLKPSDLVEWKGAHSKIQKKRTLHIRSASGMRDLWRRHAPGEPVPEVDFEVYDVVGVTLGQTHVKGKGIEIMGTRTTPDSLIVYYREAADLFRQHSMVVAYAPYHFKVIPKSDLPVQFQKI
jgi:hypothetical protein